MMALIDQDNALEWLKHRIKCPVFSVNQSVLTGKLGERHMRARCFSTGLTVSLTLDVVNESNVSGFCLLLATVPEAGDHALYSDDGQFWLMRRYPLPLKPIEVELLMRQQQAIAALLIPRTTQEKARSSLWGGSYV